VLNPLPLSIITAMDKNDLEAYQVQLSQVEVALSADPDSADLSALRDELKELIDLAQTAIAHAEAAAASTSKEGSGSGGGSSRKHANSTPTHVLSAGSDCLAKYSSDGQWYPARITSVGGSSENPVYSIVFKSYNTTELVKASEIKPLPPNYKDPSGMNGFGGGSSGGGFGGGGVGAAGKRKLTKVEEEERERKKKKNEKKLEVRAQKAKEQTMKQQSWQKFTKKSEKKGVHIAGLQGTSIFKTPDNPLGKGEWTCAFCCCCTFSEFELCSWCHWEWQGYDRGGRQAEAQIRVQ